MAVSITLFILCFPLLWIATFSCISLLGGWHKLAGHFRDDPASRESGALRWQSAALLQGGIPNSYNRILTISTDSDGIHLSIPALFRILHPPLLIPWSAVKKVEKVEFMCRDSTLVELHDTPIRLRFYGKAAGIIFRQWKKSRSH